MSKSRIRIGILGSGSMGAKHAKCLSCDREHRRGRRVQQKPTTRRSGSTSLRCKTNHRHFVDCIRGEADPELLDARGALDALTLSIATQRSLQEHQTITIAEHDPK